MSTGSFRNDANPKRILNPGPCEVPAFRAPSCRRGGWLKSLGLPNDEALARSLHDSFGRLSQRVDFEDSFHLREETVQQPEVTARDADDCGDPLLVQR